MSAITEFVKVAQSGATIDGREIKAEWLKQAAESYDKDVYTANVFPNHWESWETYGTVDALEFKENKDGVVSLFAKFNPNLFWLREANYGQKLFTSIAIEEDFAGTGKAYVYSVGATNTPASLGVEKLQFSAQKNKGLHFSDTFESDLKKKKQNKKKLGKKNSQLKPKKTTQEFNVTDMSAVKVLIDESIDKVKEEFSVIKEQKTFKESEEFKALELENKKLKKQAKKYQSENDDRFSKLEKKLNDALKEAGGTAHKGNDYTTNEELNEGII